jgi:hypothetical protein
VLRHQGRQLDDALGEQVVAGRLKRSQKLVESHR